MQPRPRCTEIFRRSWPRRNRSRPEGKPDFRQRPAGIRGWQIESAPPASKARLDPASVFSKYRFVNCLYHSDHSVISKCFSYTFHFLMTKELKFDF